MEKRRIGFGLLLILVLIMVAYFTEKIVMTQGVNTASIIKVGDKDKVYAYISTDVLRKLKSQHSDKDPSLLLTMNAAGVNGFHELEIRGQGQDQFMVLVQEDLTEDVVLSITNQGTVNLLNKKEGSFLVKDLTEIYIKN